MWQACKHVLYDVELQPSCWLLEGLQSVPTLYLGKAGLRVCPGGTFGSVCAKSVHGVSLTAWTYSRTPHILSFFPFQKAVELRLKVDLFCEGCCEITVYSCLEVGDVFLRGCTAIPLLLCS